MLKDRRVGTALFDQIMQHGQSLHSDHFSVRFLLIPFSTLDSIPGKTNFRIGVAVSKKIEKRAVGRNRIKRLIRVSILELTKSLKLDSSAPPNVKTTSAMIFFAKKGIPELAQQARNDEIAELLQKILAK